MNIEHIRQRGPNCLRATISMLGGLSQDEFDEDNMLGGKYSLGGQDLLDSFPQMLALGLCPGAIASFSAEPYRVEGNEEKKVENLLKYNLEFQSMWLMMVCK